MWINNKSITNKQLRVLCIHATKCHIYITGTIKSFFAGINLSQLAIFTDGVYTRTTLDDIFSVDQNGNIPPTLPHVYFAVIIMCTI